MIYSTFFFVRRKKVERFFPMISPPVFSLSGQPFSARKPSISATTSTLKSSSQHKTLNLLSGFSDANSFSLFRTKRRISSLRSNDTDNSSLIAQIYCASKAFGKEERRQSVHSSGPRKAYNIDRCRPYRDALLVSNKSNFLGSRIADAS